MAEYLNQKIKLDLENGVRLEIFIDGKIRMKDPHTTRFIYSYIYREIEEGKPRGEVTLYNEFKLMVDYINGIAAKCELTMHVVFPQKLGVVRLYGIDISPGAKKFIEFFYEKESINVRKKNQDRDNLVYDEAGNHKRWRLVKIMTGNGEEGLIKPIGFLSLKDIIEHEVVYEYRVPFLHMEKRVEYISFPESIIW